MAVPTASQLLDQLMGPNRNSLPGRKSIKRHWSDKDVCKYFLAAFCPNELFDGTKADMGPCPNRHADVLKEHYEKSDKYGELGYEENLQRYIQDILDDCDRKIVKARQRLEQNRAKNKEAREAAELERQQFLDQKIDHLLSKLESLGSQGNVTEAQEVADVIEKLRAEKAAPPDPLTYQRSDLTMEREMDVCEVCGALILIGDTQLRIEDHILGKQHDGYAKLRNQFNLMKEKYWLKDGAANGDNNDQLADDGSFKSKRHNGEDDRSRSRKYRGSSDGEVDNDYRRKRRRHDSSSSGGGGGDRRSRHSRRRHSSSDDNHNSRRDRKHSSRRDGERRSRRS